MADVILMPVTLRCGRGCKIEQVTTDAVGLSDPAGNSQARSYGHPRWALSLVSPPHLPDADAAAWKAMLLALRGSVNYLAAFDPSRRRPLGTLRGTLTLAQEVPMGATSALVACGADQVGRSLKAGDWLQLGSGLGMSQLVMVMADAVAEPFAAAGRITVAFEPPARQPVAAGAVVSWDHPRAYFRRPPGRVGWVPYSQGHVQAMGVDLLEAW